MTEHFTDDPNIDKKDEALTAQRFRMLEDIARELSAKDISFPTCFDAALKIRNALRDPDVQIREVVRMVGMEPLVGGLLEFAKVDILHLDADSTEVSFLQSERKRALLGVEQPVNIGRRQFHIVDARHPGGIPEHRFSAGCPNGISFAQSSGAGAGHHLQELHRSTAYLLRVRPGSAENPGQDDETEC